MSSSILNLLIFAAVAAAKTDLTGCTSSDVSSPAGASVIWYVPESGELCDFLDCGGGRAPPKTTVPGCPLYSGTATYSPSYLAGYASAVSTLASSTNFADATSTSPSTIAMSTTLVATSTVSTSDYASSESLTFLSGTSKVVSVATTTLSDGSISVSTSSKLSTSTKTTGTGSSTSASSVASSTGNSGVSSSVNVFAPSLIGALAAGFAFLL